VINADDIVKHFAGTKRPKRGGGRRPKFNWDEVRAKAFRLMDHHGDFSPDDEEWNAQARLEKALQEFCIQRFSKEPAASSLRARIPNWLKDWRSQKLIVKN
jgi:hypothetical protein